MSSLFYLRKQGALSFKGIKNKKGYLTTMYGITVGINLVLFFLVFPFTANLASASVSTEGFSSFEMSVDIPCPGHAPLINTEVEGISGVKKVEYSFPNDFVVYYDSSETSQKEVLSLDVFEEYPATLTVDSKQLTVSGPGCSGGCGGTGSCGGGCGSPSCNYNK